MNHPQVAITRDTCPAPTHEPGGRCRITGCTNQTSSGICAACAYDVLEHGETRLMAQPDFEWMKANPYRGPWPIPGSQP